MTLNKGFLPGKLIRAIQISDIGKPTTKDTIPATNQRIWRYLPGVNAQTLAKLKSRPLR